MVKYTRGALDSTLEYGYFTFISTPDDASVFIQRTSERALALGPVWNSQNGTWGYQRELRYLIVESGGYITACQKYDSVNTALLFLLTSRYRAFFETQTNVATLKQKLVANSNLEKIVGAANVWASSDDHVTLAQKMINAGLQRMQWSNSVSLSFVDVAKLNNLSVSTSMLGRL